MHDQEGEGEEHEETTHEIRSKVYKMTKDKEGKAQWGDMGVGMLRLKKHKETGSRRVLLRNSSTGKITIVRFIFSVYMRHDAGREVRGSALTGYVCVAELLDPLGHERGRRGQDRVVHGS